MLSTMYCRFSAPKKWQVSACSKKLLVFWNAQKCN